MKENNIKKNQNSNNISSTHYIKIDAKNILQEQESDTLNQMLMELVNSILVENMGKEINKFFVKILPENKEVDILKFNFSLAAKIKKKFNLNKNEILSRCELYMDYLINYKIDTSSPFSLTNEINDKLSLILAIIYRNIKQNGKFLNFEDVKKCASESSDNNNILLDAFQSKSNLNSNSSISAYMYSVDNFTDESDILDSNIRSTVSPFMSNKMSLEPRMSYRIPSKKDDIMNLNENNNNKNNIRKIPIEAILLREKFENVKIIKLSLKKINSEELIEQNDIINNIFVLTNLSFLFKNLVGIEIDLSNELILRDEIMDINLKYEQILKLTKKNRKATSYKTENKKRIYDVYKNKTLQSNKLATSEDVESIDNTSSYFSFIEPNEEIKKKQERFLTKHLYSLQMIAVYWYFIAKLDYIKTFHFIIPINFEEKILLMLKESKIISFDFNIFSDFTNKLSEITLDFNSLDNKIFLQILSFLFSNSQLTKCCLSLFPSEEYFEPRHLYNLFYLAFKTRFKKKEIKVNEDMDVFILRKLSEFFEINISKLFCYFINMPKLKEISLVFDMPSILDKVSNYEIVIIKLIINLFMHINNTKYSLRKLTILSDNLNFDNRKYPFLSEFFETIDLYQKQTSQIDSLTLKFKIFDLNNLYRIIPYNVNHLSLGSFDLISFQYFVEYITSSEFSIHSQIQYLQITLANSILILDEECFSALEKLLVEFPKKLEEICINTNLQTTTEQINNLLKNTNYNKIQKITIQFNDINFENKIEKDIYKTPQKKNNIIDESNQNSIDLYYIKIDEFYEKFKNQTLNMMYKVGKKYNKDFMDYNIFSELEKFLCNKGKKIINLQDK